MKNSISKLIIALLTFLFIISCNEAETIVDADPTETQVLIIEKYDAAKIESILKVYEEEEDENNLPYNLFIRLKIFDTYRVAYPNPSEIPLEEFIDQMKLQRNINIDFEAKHKPSVPFPDSLRTIGGLGSIKIGDLDINTYRGVNKVIGGWFVWFYESRMGCLFSFDPECDYEFTDIINNSISGSTQFSITNSPIMQDINSNLIFSGHCEITNIVQNQEIDPQHELTIELKEPIGGSGNYMDGYLVLIAHQFEVNIFDGGWSISSIGVAGTTIMPLERTTTITIPSEELIKFKEENNDANKFSIHLTNGYHGIDIVSINNDADSSTFGIIKQSIYKNFETFIRFKE